jgi:hypothetical protein
VSSVMVRSAELLRADLSVFDADCYSGSECVVIVEVLAATEKACSAARVLAAAGVVREQAYIDRGFSDGERWLAQQSGSTRSDARRALQTAGQLEDCPDTKQALLAGLVSLAQASGDRGCGGGDSRR